MLLYVDVCSARARYSRPGRRRRHAFRGRRAFRNAERSRTRRPSRRRAFCNAPAFQNVWLSGTRRSSGRRAFQNVRRSRRRRRSRRARVLEGAPSGTRRPSRRRRPSRKPDPMCHVLIAEFKATLSMWRASDGKRPKPMKGKRPPKFLVKRHLLDHPVQTLCTLASARARPREPGQRKITLSTCPPYAYLTPCVPLSMLVPAAPRGSIGPRVLSGYRCAREPRHGTGKSAFSARGKIADSRCEQ